MLSTPLAFSGVTNSIGRRKMPKSRLVNPLQVFAGRLGGRFVDECPHDQNHDDHDHEPPNFFENFDSLLAVGGRFWRINDGDLASLIHGGFATVPGLVLP